MPAGRRHFAVQKGKSALVLVEEGCICICILYFVFFILNFVFGICLVDFKFCIYCCAEGNVCSGAGGGGHWDDGAGSVFVFFVGILYSVFRILSICILYLLLLWESLQQLWLSKKRRSLA